MRIESSRFVCRLLLFAFASALVLAMPGAGIAEAPVRASVVKSPRAMGALEQEQATILEDYGSFLLVECAGERQADRLGRFGAKVNWVSGGEWLGLRDYAFDTQAQTVAAGAPARLLIDEYPDEGKHLYILQFHGPIKDQWLDVVRKAGGEIIDYLPDYAYVVRMTPSARRALETAPMPLGPAGLPPLVWSGIHQPAYRISRALLGRSGPVAVSLLLLDTEQGRALAGRLAAEGELLSPLAPAPPYLRMRVVLDGARLEKLAFEPGVYWMEEWNEPRPWGEVGALNVAGQAVNGEVAGYGDAGVSYLDWLGQKGFDTSSVWNVVVNVSDTGLDKGNRAGSWHQDLYDGAGSASRVAYAKDWTSDQGGPNDGTDGDGHGTNCAGVIGGYNDAAGVGNGEVSTKGYHFGLGVAPFVKVGGSKLFNYNGNWDLLSTYSQVESYAWSQGARISSNSWGTSDNTYSSDARTYDQLVRDASSDPGNQQMIILFAAGNDGPSGNSVGSPGTAKNVITLGAAENWWPSYSSCGWPSALEDTPGDDVVYYSSRGPTADGRTKPDLVAIANGWNTLRGQFAGTGCGDPFDTGDTALYRNFNGTSAATPATAGAAALVYQWALDNWGVAPSPALMKAILVATARDLAGGVNATSTSGTGPALTAVPNNNQGWGLVDVGRVFDGSSSVRVDQSELFGETGQSYQQTVIVDDPARPVRVVLAWTDAPGNPGGDAWMNDLDLEVNHDGQTYLGNVLEGGVSVTGGNADYRNNLEVVILPAGSSGSLEITVRGANIAADGVPGNGDATDQDFALYVYNAQPCDAPNAPAQLSSSVPADNRVDLSWSAVGGGVTGYAVYRAKVSGGPYSKIATVGAAETTYSDTSVSGGTTYYYVVRSIRTCESPSSGETSAAATGICTAPPEFAGLTSATNAAASTCEVDLAWSPATSQCGGSVTYRVYRSTTSGFAPGPANRIASGLSGTGHADTSAVEPGTTYYYVVRAADSVEGLVDANTVEQSATPTGPTSGPTTYSSADTPRPIPDNTPAGTTSTIAISGGGTIADLQLDVDITHTYTGDLIVKLTSPGGSSVTVHNGSGGGADNIVTTYDSLTAPDGPGTMNDFDGMAVAGSWSLNVSDNASWDTGTLNGWSLDATTYGSCTPGASGQPGEVSPSGDALFARGTGSAVDLTYSPGAGSSDTTVYRGTAAAPLDALEWNAAYCGLGATGSAGFDPGTPPGGQLFYFVAVANDGSREGSYGHDSGGGERVDANGLSCDYPQILERFGPPGSEPSAPSAPKIRPKGIERLLPGRLGGAGFHRPRPLESRAAGSRRAAPRSLVLETGRRSRPAVTETGLFEAPCP